MAQSIPDIKLTLKWVSVNQAAIAIGGVGFAVGDSIKVQKKGEANILLWEGEEPELGSASGYVLTDNEPSVTYSTGSDEVWARRYGGGSAVIHVVQGGA